MKIGQQFETLNVTDEMVDVAQDTYDVLADRACERNAIGKAVEAAMQAAWVKFDINNPTTYPRAGAHAFRYIVRTTNGVQKITTIAHWDGRNWFANQMNIDVTHWMLLPEYKGG